MELLQDPLPKSSGNIKLFDNRSQELPYMVIYVNMTKIDNLVQNILVKVKQIQDFHGNKF